MGRLTSFKVSSDQNFRVVSGQARSQLVAFGIEQTVDEDPHELAIVSYRNVRKGLEADSGSGSDRKWRDFAVKAYAPIVPYSDNPFACNEMVKFSDHCSRS